MKRYYSILICSCLLIAYSNSFAQQVISSSGAFYSNSNGSLSVTLGETVVTTVQNNTINLILTQGFQQQNNQSTVPLQLIAFNATKQNNAVQLQWKTINEFDIASFTIQRSTDGRTFESIGDATPKNNFTQENSYQFTDNYTIIATIYYRIVIREKNGNTQYSWIVNLTQKAEQIKVYPVPAKTNLTIEIFQSENNKKQLQIFDLSGKLVYNQLHNLLAGKNLLTISITHLPVGTYLLKGLNETSIKIIKEN